MRVVFSVRNALRPFSYNRSVAKPQHFIQVSVAVSANVSLLEEEPEAEKLIINNNSYKGHSSESLGPYLAGLLEGVGYISLSKAIKVPLLRCTKVKNTSPYIAITFVNKDIPLINKLVEKFGGRLRFKIKENAIV